MLLLRQIEYNVSRNVGAIELDCSGPSLVTLEVLPGQPQGQGEGWADQAISAKSPGHAGVRSVILTRGN